MRRARRHHRHAGRLRRRRREQGARSSPTRPVPYLTVRGRRGGSAIASAAFNAIAGGSCMTAWLHIIGVGEAGVAELPASTRLILAYAETVLGPPRFLAELEQSLSTSRRPSEVAPPTSVNARGLEAVATRSAR